MKKMIPSVELLKKWKTTGAISFSSSFLVEKMIKCIDFNKAKIIVELGAGNGCITKGLLAKMRKDAILISIEINEEFCSLLNKTIEDTRLQIICGDAIESLQSLGLEIDYIVSSIPFKVLSKKERTTLITAIKDASNKKTVFVQFSYFISMYSFLKDNFNKVKIGFTPLNIPPAFVFKCGLS